LAETQLRLLEAERVASRADADPRPAGAAAQREERSPFATRPRSHLHPIEAAGPAPEESSTILTSLRERISELRSAVDETQPDVARDEPVRSLEDPPMPTPKPTPTPTLEDAKAFRERLSRAAEARHRVATE